MARPKKISTMPQIEHKDLTYVVCPKHRIRHPRGSQRPRCVAENKQRTIEGPL
jgi:hypothetical protein